MENNIKLSIIVPVFNIEKYIDKCLDSLLNQNVEKDSYEIVCINDGSTDNSLKILTEYEKNNSNIKVIDKKNGGVSSARNVGLENVKGEYIMFVDGDDLLVPNALKTLYNYLGNDIVQFSFLYVEENFELNKDGADIKEQGAVNYKDWLVNKLYRKSVIDKNYIRFNQNMQYSEDVLFGLISMTHSESILEIQDCLYLYRQRSTSAMHVFNKEHNNNRIKSFKLFILGINNQCLPYLEKNSELYKYLKYDVLMRSNIPILRISPYTDEKMGDIIRFFKENDLYPIEKDKTILSGKKTLKKIYASVRWNAIRFRFVYFLYYYWIKLFVKKRK